MTRKKIYLREIILGGQDGLVNVLGIVLAVAVATKDPKIIIIAGLAATFAESISMGAVEFTSSRAVRDHYKREQTHELAQLEADQEGNPVTNAIWVFVSAMLGSFVPLISFFFFSVPQAIGISLVLSAVVLFGLGFFKATVTVGNPFKEGLQMTAIGLLAALAGYAIGAALGVVV